MKRILLKTLLFLLPLLLWQCNELKDWSDPADSVPPGTVSGVLVENTHGGARITYTRPGDTDLLGVKAVYTLADGVAREIFASAFTDTITLEGYPDTQTYTVELVAIDKSYNVSAPVPVQIRPLTPPIDLIRESLTAMGTFGGIYLKWDNNFGKPASLGVTLFLEDAGGVMNVMDAYYSNLPYDQYTFRPYDSIPQKFGINLRDQYGNSAYLDTVITPLFERNIPGRDIYGNVWEQYELNRAPMRGDITWNQQAFSIIHDGVEAVQDGNGRYWQVYVSAGDFDGSGQGTGDYVMPFGFTIDMGRKANYSRFKIWMRGRPPLYSAVIPQDFEVWGTNDPKSTGEIGDGSQIDNLRYWTDWKEVGNIKDINGTNAWKNDWEQLGSYFLRLPSGIVYTTDGTITNEDNLFISAGFDFDIFPEMAGKPFRYLRFWVKDTNTHLAGVQICEIKFYGAYAD